MVTSEFKQALAHVRLPAAILEGVEVRRVQMNGSMRESFLTLSSDRFTLYVTSSKRGSIPNAGGGLFGGMMMMRKKKNPVAPHHHHHHHHHHNAAPATNDNSEELSIDIGAIDRIQRGQATHKFELAK